MAVVKASAKNDWLNAVYQGYALYVKTKIKTRSHKTTLAKTKTDKTWSQGASRPRSRLEDNSVAIFTSS